MDRRTDVVSETGECQLRSACPAADRLLRFDEADRAPGLSQRDRGSETVRARADNDCVRRLVPYDLYEPAPVALAVELEEEPPLPRAEAESAVANGPRFARRAKQHRHAVRVPIAEVHVLRADVLGALVPVVVRV